MEKQTALEWLVEQMDIKNPTWSINKQIQQAKEMEKQQIIDAHNDGHNYYEVQGVDAEQYYNQTFKN